jgi:hypothetical protein
MIAKSDFGIGKAILKGIGQVIGKELGREMEIWVWFGLIALMAATLVGLHTYARRRRSKSPKE